MPLFFSLPTIENSWGLFFLSAIIGVSFLILLFYWFDFCGVACFISVTSLIANIQVLKTSHFTGLSAPLPLGTALFSCIFLSVDLILEIYGKKKATQAIALSFLILLFWNIFALLTLTFIPAEESTIIHQSMKLLFEPGPRLLVASILAYISAIFVECFIFSALSKLWGGKHLWIRANISSWISSALDGFLFSFLAWRLFASNPVSFHTIIFTYMLGAWLARIVASFIGTPALYLALYIHNKKNV